MKCDGKTVGSENTGHFPRLSEGPSSFETNWCILHLTTQEVVTLLLWKNPGHPESDQDMLCGSAPAIVIMGSPGEELFSAYLAKWT